VPPRNLSRFADSAARSLDSVPRLSSFYGITILMFWNEGVHARPHFHARYAGRAASVDFDGELVAGVLPPRALLLVGDWVRLHRPELQANWERARRSEPLESSIPPLECESWSAWSMSSRSR
jgi:hypothetical protein